MSVLRSPMISSNALVPVGMSLFHALRPSLGPLSGDFRSSGFFTLYISILISGQAGGDGRDGLVPLERGHAASLDDT